MGLCKLLFTRKGRETRGPRGSGLLGAVLWAVPYRCVLFSLNLKASASSSKPKS